MGHWVKRNKRPLPADEELELGGSTHQALKGYAENAELDENALKVYDPVLSRAELEQRLHDDDYRKMAAFWPEDDSVLWSTCQGFVSYGPEEDFYLPVSVRAARSQGATTVEYDRYRCLPVAVTAADGCQTQADHDYRLMQPVRIVDANANTQEALYDSFGAMRASSYHGTELGKPAGFAPIADYRVTLTSPIAAIADPHAALQGAASAHFSDPFAWMGQVPQAMLDDSDWLARHVAQGDVLPDGHIRHSARDRLARDPQTREWLMQAKREPVFAASLQADRYPDDPEPAQIRIALTSWDGFGRVLQTRQKVEPGDAHRTQSDGTLVMSDGQPQNAFSLSRWRVSERVEYNNKGLVIRAYRPFFADAPGYIDDTALKDTAFFDQQFYDPLGRPTLTITAKGLWRRHRYLGWYSISEDENDTYEEAMQAKAAKAAKEREHIASAAFRTAGGRHIANEMATLHNKANANISSEPGKNALAPPGPGTTPNTRLPSR
jgi:hypothetical protein